MFLAPKFAASSKFEANQQQFPVQQHFLPLSSSNLIFRSMRTGMFSYTTYEDQTNEPHFLDACHLCRKPLGNNSDIFMYRGNTPFCSKDCRQEVIKLDENKEKSWKVTSSRRKSDPNKNSTPNKNVRTGSVAVA